jgi:hypothetical protein
MADYYNGGISDVLFGIEETANLRVQTQHVEQFC